ncbi:glutamate--cysteine ligase catalytic subunit-like [Tachypleus tridentatus]|uniref:glutamate--cysteine ligase catalytic subunit-like n=1 Tax=Tachypleus tridentatus TaxID=6853 RepID=UPI003FD29580
MKLLENPHVLSWDELLKHADKARMLACKQFIYHYNQHKYRSGDPFKWGDETEGHIVKFNHETKTVRLCLRASSVLKKLKEKHSLVGMWTDECTESMLECCPQEPFGDVLNCFHLIEENMSKRKKEVLASLECDETYINMGMFPRLGTKQFTEPAYKPTPNFGLCKSLFIPDGFICVENEAYRALAILNDTRKGNEPL